VIGLWLKVQPSICWKSLLWRTSRCFATFKTKSQEFSINETGDIASLMRDYQNTRSSKPANSTVVYSSARMNIAHLSAVANRKPAFRPVDSAKLPGGQSSSHVTLYPAFCCRSQSWRGWKYSIRGPASISRLPVITSMASGHGFDEPNPNIRLRTHKNTLLFSSRTGHMGIWEMNHGPPLPSQFWNTGCRWTFFWCL